jgi:uncharacterized membrane protein (Fun14 family)
MDLLGEVVTFITNGNILGLPTLVAMSIPLILGLIVGLTALKFLKAGMMVMVVLAVVIYLGLNSMDINTLHQLALQYGLSASLLSSLLIGVLPLGVGFVIGTIIGF